MLSNPSINSVYRKSSKVEGLLRLRGLELIAGTENTSTIHKEHGIKIWVDIAKAYFSPRLATEHDRVAGLVPPGSRVLDLFGSLAPFALHIATRNNSEVVSVDVNPYVPDLITRSINSNKLIGNIEIICDDAHAYLKGEERGFDVIIMNHPSGAFQFLDEATEHLRDGGVIFYYDFIEIDGFESTIRKKLSPNPLRIVDIHVVRQSSPNEYHLCVQLQK